MAEDHESQELAIPGKIVKSKGKGVIAQTVRDILRRPAARAIEKTPQVIEQTPGEMSVERARKILEYIVGVDGRGLDAHERKLTPAEQFQRFGGIHYEDIKKAFGVYADHLIATHDTIKPQGKYRKSEDLLLKEDLPGPLSRNSSGARYYDLQLSILTHLEKPKKAKSVRLTLCDGTRDGHVRQLRVESDIPLVDDKPGSSGEHYSTFYDGFTRDGRHISTSLPMMRTWAHKYANEEPQYNQQFHDMYRNLHRGMRWTAANLLCWDENRIVYPADLDKLPLTLDRGQAQLNKPKLELPPKQ